jgi:hypothetical protein
MGCFQDLSPHGCVPGGKRPTPESEKMEYEMAENRSYSDRLGASEMAVTDGNTITCNAPVASEATRESNSIPRNILGGFAPKNGFSASPDGGLPSSAEGTGNVSTTF